MSENESMDIDPPTSPLSAPDNITVDEPAAQKQPAPADSSISSVVSNAANNSGLTVELHPLTLLNISDHYTRIKMQQQIQKPQVIGALLGTQSGRDVEISNSYELSFNVVDGGHVIVDKEYFTTKQEQFRQVFPHFDFLGWYTLGPFPTPDHIEIHKQLLEYNESPLFLQMNPHEIVTSKNLPITVYESIIDIVDGQANLLFIKAQYKIETGEAERIAVDHVAHTTSGEGTEGSSLIAHLTTQGNAIKMLHTRIKMLHRYLVDYKKGDIAADHDILRQIASLCNRMPTMDGDEFREEFLTEYNDVLLTSYLATITKGTNSINELVDKFNIATSSQGNRNRRHQSFGCPEPVVMIYRITGILYLIRPIIQIKPASLNYFYTEMADTNQPQPLQQTQPVHLDPERERFLIELEFVQSFANPFYITYLAQKGFLDNPAFVNYLKYLQYWKRPEYAKFIIYPHSLFFLDLLQNQLFRDKMKDELNAEKLHSTQFYHRFAWDSLQVRSSGGKLDPYVEAQRQLEELEREQLQKQAGNGIISGNTQQQLLNGMQPGAVDGHPSTGRMAVHGAAPISGSGQAQNVVNGRIK